MLHEVHQINEAAYAEWREFRTKELKKKLGPIAEKKQRKFLSQYNPVQQQEIIDQSIMNSWQGLFAPKPQQQPGNGRTSIQHDLTDQSW